MLCFQDKNGGYAQLIDDDSPIENQKKEPNVKLWKIIYHVIKKRWYFSGLLLFINSALSFIGTFVFFVLHVKPLFFLSLTLASCMKKENENTLSVHI